MAHLVTRTPLARVTRLSHRPIPLLFTPKPTIYCSPTHPLLRPAMDRQPPESSVPVAAAASSSPVLSRNVLVLSCESAAEGGFCDVYLVGTDHGSEESCREVQAILNFLKPQVVFLELCSSRMPTDTTLQNLKAEVTILKKELNEFEVLYDWLLAEIDSELEAVRSCEFCVAYEEAIKYGGRVILGDRPIEITLWRTWRKMPLWHKTKLLISLFLRIGFVIRQPRSHDLYKMRKEMGDNSVSSRLVIVFHEMMKKFATINETIVHERDQYMSSTLLEVASENSSVVAVVGKAHLQGIKKHWKQPVAMKDLMTVPSPKSKSIGVAVAGVAIISGIYLSCKK